jgi:hypothetical protein
VGLSCQHPASSDPAGATSRSRIVSAESAAWCPVRVATPAGPSVSQGQPGVGSADSGVAESAMCPA